MKAVILAGGRGTRLAPVTHGAVPKPMAELLGAPMLEHIVALLKRCGFRDLCCTTACLPEQIERYFGDGSGFGVRMQYRREDRALGTAGAVKNCEDFIAGENALIISGDAACDFDLRALWNEHRRAHAAVTMALYPHEAPLPYGLAVTDGEGWVRSFIEKPAWERVVTDLVNTGIYVLSPEVLRFIPADTPFDFARDLFPRLMASGRDATVTMPAVWMTQVLSSVPAKKFSSADALQISPSVRSTLSGKTPASRSPGSTSARTVAPRESSSETTVRPRKPVAPVTR